MLCVEDEEFGWVGGFIELLCGLVLCEVCIYVVFGFMVMFGVSGVMVVIFGYGGVCVVSGVFVVGILVVFIFYFF